MSDGNVLNTQVIETWKKKRMYVGNLTVCHLTADVVFISFQAVALQPWFRLLYANPGKNV